VGIRELADHLELSIATASRALNDKGEVSADTRQRVIEAAARLGYSPHQAGRSLRQGRSSTVGLMLPAKGPEESYTLPLSFPLSEGIQSVLARHAIDLVAERSFPLVAFGRSDSGGLHSWVDLDRAAYLVVFIVANTLPPCIVFFLLFQRTLTRGVTAGAVK